MSVQKGALLLIKKSGTAIAGDTNATVSVDDGLLDYRTKGMTGTGREYDDQDLSISGDSLVALTDASLVAIMAAKYAHEKLTDVAATTALGVFSGTFLVESFDIKGGVGDMQQATYTLKSDGGYTFTPA